MEIVVEKTGPANVLQVKSDSAKPSVPPGKILVRNEFAGVNYIDIYFRNGSFPRPLPFVPGQEGAGIVEAVGAGVKDFSVGQRVGYLSSGSYAQYTVVPEEGALVLPENISTQQAATLMLQGGTVVYLTHRIYKVKRGDWVLVTAAAGGVGQLLCQVCRALGAKVIGITSSPGKVALIERLADKVFVSSDSLSKSIMELTEGHGVNVIYDGVGGEGAPKQLIPTLAKFGQFVNFGAAGGPLPPVDITVGMWRCLGFHSVSLAAFTDTKEGFRTIISDAFQLFLGCAMRPTVFKVYPLNEAAQAHTDLEGKRTHGKLLLQI